jgi:hypothetical protein
MSAIAEGSYALGLHGSSQPAVPQKPVATPKKHAIVLLKPSSKQCESMVLSNMSESNANGSSTDSPNNTCTYHDDYASSHVRGGNIIMK